MAIIIKYTNDYGFRAFTVTGSGSYVHVSGVVTASEGFSGSLTRLATGESYLVAGTNVTIASQSNGSIIISATGGGSGSSGPDADWTDNGGNLFTTSSLNVENSASFAGPVTSSLGFSGSLHRLIDGSPAWLAGDGINITSQSNGALTIAVTQSFGTIDGGGFTDIYTSPSLDIDGGTF